MWTTILGLLAMGPVWGAEAPAAGPAPVELSARAEEGGFSSVSEPGLGLDLQGLAGGGHAYRFLGKLGSRRLELSVRREVRLEYGERIEVARIEGDGVDASLLPRTKGRHEYSLSGSLKAADGSDRGFSLRFDPQSSSGGMEYEVRSSGPGLRARTRTAAGRTVLSGDYDASALEPAGLAAVGIGLVVLRLDPPVRGARKDGASLTGAARDGDFDGARRAPSGKIEAPAAVPGGTDAMGKLPGTQQAAGAQSP